MEQKRQAELMKIKKQKKKFKERIQKSIQEKKRGKSTRTNAQRSGKTKKEAT